MTSKVLVAGIGMIPFSKPGASPSYTEMGSQALHEALADAGLHYAKIQTAYAGYVYGDSTCGQTAIYEAGRTGIPIFNVNNNCASGSSALYLARAAVESGQVDCALALGFEQMQAGALKNFWDDRPLTRARFRHVLEDLTMDVRDLPQALRTFGGAGREHMQKYGTSLEAFAAVRAKASRHAANNPFAVFRNVVTTEDVLNDKVLWPGVMTRLMACPPTCGAAAAILVSEDFADRNGLRADVKIIAQEITTDEAISFDPPSMISYAGYHMTKAGAQRIYERTGIGPGDIKVAELHDCFAHNELISYEGLGFCGEGEGEKFVMDGDNTYGGKVVTNPSGGLLSKGHPLGATGLAQCFELTNQLRGTAGARQVDNVDIALQHNIGLGGACVITMYGRN
jgi:acetyl-CoA acetyltransferase